MTNVINTSTNSALTSNVHATSITQQSDDLLPSLASLSFSVSNSTSSGETSATSSAVHVNQTLKEESNETTTTLSTLLNPIVNNNTVDAKDLKKQVDSAELQGRTNMLTVLTSQSTGSVASVSPSMSASQSQYDFTTKISEENSSVAAMWSNIDDGSNHNAVSNGFKNNSNYSNSLVTTLMNNTNLSNIQHQNRRAITASHGGFQPGLPPNNCAPRNMMPPPSIQQQQQQQQHGNHPHNMHKSNPQDHQSHHMAMQQQQQQPQQHPHQQNLNFHQTPNAIDRDPMHEQHRHQQKPNMYNSNYPVWSNPASSMPWQAQQQQAAINNSIPVRPFFRNFVHFFAISFFSCNFVLFFVISFFFFKFRFFCYCLTSLPHTKLAMMNFMLFFSIFTIKKFSCIIERFVCVIFFFVAATNTSTTMESWPFRSKFKPHVEQFTKSKANVAESRHVDVCICSVTMRHYVTNEIQTQHIISWQSTRSKFTASQQRR